MSRKEMATLNDGNDGSCSQKFSNEAAAILESLYSSGMTGWGRDHSDSISTAISSTGLTLSQVKVCMEFVQI